MSGGRHDDWPTWLTALITDGGARHLVGHSIGAAAAVEAAAAHPTAVERLTLVAPYFLQARPALTTQWAPLTRGYLSHVSPDALAKRLTGTTAHATALASSVADLRRGTVAANVSRLLAAAAKPRWREALRAQLRRYPGRVHVIVGSDDPLTPDGRALLDALPHATVTVVDGANHHLQLTHPEEVAKAIGHW